MWLLWSCINQMHNDILTVGSITIHGYGLMIGIGFLTAVLLTAYRAKKNNLDAEFVYDLAFTAIIGGMLGAKLLFIIVEIKSIIENPKILLDIANGFVVYGGIIGGILASFILCKIKNKQFIKYFDLVMPSVAIAQGFGRIGCFLAGCCYGRETTSAFGVVFTNSQFAPNGVRLIPTQLISSAGDFLIGLFLIFISKRTKKDGHTGSMYLILYGMGRFLVEFLRNDNRGNVGSLSTSQFISLFIVASGIISTIIINKNAILKRS